MGSRPFEERPRVWPSCRLGTVVVSLSVIAFAWCDFPSPVSAQTTSTDPILAWLQQEKAKLEQQITRNRQLESRTEATLLRGQGVQAEARRINDMAAERVADQAVNTARSALAKAKAARELAEVNLAIINRAVAINQECADLRARAERDREALRRQLGASELIREGSSSQPILIASRTGMAAAKLAILANQFSKYNRLLIEAIKNIQFLQRHAAEVRPLVLTSADLETLSTTWAGINAARTAEDCSEELKGWSTYSHLMENAIAIGKCLKAVDKAAEFMRLHGQALEKVGKVLGIAVPAVEFANEVRELHEELKQVEDYTRSYPDMALQAARRLDERQKATLERVAECQQRFVGVMGEMR